MTEILKVLRNEKSGAMYGKEGSFQKRQVLRETGKQPWGGGRSSHFSGGREGGCEGVCRCQAPASAGDTGAERKPTPRLNCTVFPNCHFGHEDLEIGYLWHLMGLFSPLPFLPPTKSILNNACHCCAQKGHRETLKQGLKLDETKSCLRSTQRGMWHIGAMCFPSSIQTSHKKAMMWG